MPNRRFRLLNVFAESPLSGNPLCVFEDGEGLSDETMQALALQFNLSETTFVFPSKLATAHVRIFTPSFELPFAGHPTLGTAHVVRALLDTGNTFTLETQAGVIPVTAAGDVWTLRARAPSTTQPVQATSAEVAAMLGLDPLDLHGEPLWVNAGSEQLLVRVVDPDAVRRCRPDAALLAKHAVTATSPGLVYVWAHHDIPPVDGREQIVARFFFIKQGILVEDPGTGSACANLGGWFVATRHELPLSIRIDQGEQTGRRSALALDVDGSGGISVGGRVIEVGRGEITGL